MVEVMLTHILMAVLGILLIVLIAAALAMLRTLHDIAYCLYAMDGELIKVDEMEEPTMLPRPPNETKSQARANEYTSPLVRRAAENLTKRRNEAKNG